MNLLANDFIRPLRLAENNFLQVLLSEFKLIREGAGVGAELHFDQDTPAIWHRQAKTYLYENTRDFAAKAERYQRELDSFLIHGQGASYEFHDPEFLFRYGSGGALPVLRMGRQNYYCLFYRDIYPVGWNIANGGCDSREELLNPAETIERELREELIIVDPGHSRRYVFEADVGKPLEHPDFAVARRFWLERFRELSFPSFEEWQIPLKWLEGPDTLTVRFGKDEAATVSGCFLNINAQDFGIEIDRIAKMNVDDDVIVCDGELLEGRLVNELVGLFEVGRFNRILKAGASEFIPDLIYYDAQRHTSEKLPDLIKTCLQNLARLRSEPEKRQYESSASRYDLCPVTRKLAERHLKMEVDVPRNHGRPGPAGGSCDVFISFGSEDRELAKNVYEFLRRNTDKRLFFSDETLHQTEFGREIDSALDSAACLVAVGSSVEHLTKPWVDFEWRSFHQDLLSGKKRRDAQMLSVVCGLDPLDLPRPLRYRKAIKYDPSGGEAALRELTAYLP